ncbi:unnamed protein product, partial [Symbiodinium sp. CCMP2456]
TTGRISSAADPGKSSGLASGSPRTQEPSLPPGTRMASQSTTSQTTRFRQTS